MSIKLNAQSGGSVALDAPTQTTNSADLVFKLPVADGSAGQVLKTDGSKNLSFGAGGNTGGLQVLEQFYSLADGSSFTTSQGTITLANVTSVLNLTQSFQTLDGSEITYTPPSGTVQVIYEIQFGLRSADSSAILGGHLRIGADTILDSRFGLRGSTNYSDMLYYFKYGINIGGSTSSTTGRQAAWTSGKTLKLELNEHNDSYEWIANILGNYGSDGHQGVCMRPRIGITAIGTV
tara:strand:- start:629 stop:1333 length:705 start_codon:yes stop_codon:yes gene_type:complete